MNRKQGVVFVLVFISGLIVGALAVATIFGRSVGKAFQNSELHYRVDLEQRAYQAYFQEDPKIGIWALQNLAEVLSKQAEIIKDDRGMIQMDLMLTYVRIALLSQAANDNQKYQQSITKALALARDIYPEKKKTQEELVSLVKRIDDNYRKKHDPAKE